MSEGSREPRVGIVIGSDADLEVLQEAVKVLDSLKIPCELTVASAHRTPERTRRWVHEAMRRGVRVFIAGAGGAAALPGFVAAETTLPVIGVPIPSVLNGLDSLLSMVQMPKGLPVATVAIGKPGAANAGILAAQILAVADADLARRLTEHRSAMAREVEARAQKVEEAMKRGRPPDDV
ncbi:MAG TPA: 5-(carboxyamino)imidazole ribonucleotide mutase [Methylomirabilota bacterium]|jgi:phosphoribosylaminoimidazole carboxylase PurE protein|nr:5-(carboxyamino)imidazole ribonucleotide mutase [Methylomirabilota bacterium]